MTAVVWSGNLCYVAMYIGHLSVTLNFWERKLAWLWCRHCLAFEKGACHQNKRWYGSPVVYGTCRHEWNTSFYNLRFTYPSAPGPKIRPTRNGTWKYAGHLILLCARKHIILVQKFFARFVKTERHKLRMAGYRNGPMSGSEGLQNFQRNVRFMTPVPSLTQYIGKWRLVLHN
jgi:hypothetical protein